MCLEFPCLLSFWGQCPVHCQRRASVPVFFGSRFGDTRADMSNACFCRCVCVCFEKMTQGISLFCCFDEGCLLRQAAPRFCAQPNRLDVFRVGENIRPPHPCEQPGGIRPILACTQPQHLAWAAEPNLADHERRIRPVAWGPRTPHVSTGVGVSWRLVSLRGF